MAHPDPLPEYVWYCSYGSNLLRDRFHKYIIGGQVPNASRIEKGSSDRTLPLEERCFILDRSFHFAHKSTSWGGGGVAFLEHTSNGRLIKSEGNMYVDLGSALEAFANGTEHVPHITICKAYLITKQQFTDVTRQENASRPTLTDELFDTVIAQCISSDTGAVLVQKGWYGRLLHFGNASSILHPDATFPIYSFTSDEDFTLHRHPPAEGYIRTIARGIRECIPELTVSQIVEYLSHKTHGLDALELAQFVQLEYPDLDASNLQ